MFKDQDFDTKINGVAEMLIATMVLGNAVYHKGKLNDQDFKAFLGYTNIRESLLTEYENMLVDLRNENKDGIESRLIELANWNLQEKYAVALSDSESLLLSKLTDLESSLI